MTLQYDSMVELEIDRDENIKSAIGEFILAQGWERAVICGAVGSVRDVTLTTPIGFELPPKVMKTPCDGPGEVLAFTGEIMKTELIDPMLRKIYSSDEPLFIHIHMSLAIAGSHVYGGGLDSGRAFRGLRVFFAGARMCD